VRTNRNAAPPDTVVIECEIYFYGECPDEGVEIACASQLWFGHLQNEEKPAPFKKNVKSTAPENSKSKAAPPAKSDEHFYPKSTRKIHSPTMGGSWACKDIPAIMCLEGGLAFSDRTFQEDRQNRASRMRLLGDYPIATVSNFQEKPRFALRQPNRKR
jgi:hypothetical protein